MQTVNQLLKAKGGQIFSVGPADSVLHAIEIMATRHVGALLVMGEDGLVGIMTEGRFRHLPVVDSGRVVGMLSIGDLVKAVIADQSQKIEQLERYIAG
jgi:CBS domain-containing protein